MSGYEPVPSAPPAAVGGYPAPGTATGVPPNVTAAYPPVQTMGAPTSYGTTTPQPQIVTYGPPAALAPNPVVRETVIVKENNDGDAVAAGCLGACAAMMCCCLLSGNGRHHHHHHHRRHIGPPVGRFRRHRRW